MTIDYNAIDERLKFIERRLDLIDEFQEKFVYEAEKRAKVYLDMYEAQRQQRIEYRDKNTVLRREIKKLKKQLKQAAPTEDAADG